MLTAQPLGLLRLAKIISRICLSMVELFCGRYVYKMEAGEFVGVSIRYLFGPITLFVTAILVVTYFRYYNYPETADYIMASSQNKVRKLQMLYRNLSFVAALWCSLVSILCVGRLIAGGLGVIIPISMAVVVIWLVYITAREPIYTNINIDSPPRSKNYEFLIFVAIFGAAGAAMTTLSDPIK